MQSHAMQSVKALGGCQAPARCVPLCPVPPCPCVSSRISQSHSLPQRQYSVGSRIRGLRFVSPLQSSSSTVAASTAVSSAPTTSTAVSSHQRPLKVVIAGAGIGGLVLALALLKQGIQVQCLERDLTAIRGEGKYRGPIQIQSNALGALEAIDAEIAQEIMDEGCITGDRINGLCDGVTGDWYVKFDTFHPAVDRGLPVTRVISRVSLQHILAKHVQRLAGEDAILGNAHVTSYEEFQDPETSMQQVAVITEDGRRFSGDVLVGADGIWSKIRKQLIGETAANYSQYTCYTGISDFTPADIDIVGYRVFLGNRQYFVSSDVGGGKMQWYAFHKEPAGGTDPPGQRKARLLELFGHWNDNVVDLIKATPEEDVLRRDIYDRPPIFKWNESRVVLLGDSAHAMQPNLGQGGCMAIEDAYQLAQDLSSAVGSADGDVKKVDVAGVLQHYWTQRMMRASTIHGMAGMAALMASTYKAYLGEQLGPLSWITKFGIHHPGRVVGQLVLKLTMPMVLEWVLGGNVSHLDGSRTPHCRLADKPKTFSEAMFPLFMRDDTALIRAVKADWLLLTERQVTEAEASRAGSDVVSTSEAKGIYITEEPSVVGCSRSQGAKLVVEGVPSSSSPQQSQFARVWRKGAGSYMVQDLNGAGTWLNGRQMAAGSTAELQPGDLLEFGSHPAREVYKVKMQHVSLRNSVLTGHSFSTLLVGKRGTEQQEEQQEERRALALA